MFIACLLITFALRRLLNTECFILNGTKRIAQRDCRNVLIQPKQIYSATTIIQVLFGDREKLANDELAARGAVKQNVVHAGESILRFRICKISSVTVVQRHFRTKLRKEPPHRHNIAGGSRTGCSSHNGVACFTSRTDIRWFQALKPTNKPLRKKFCVKFQEKLDVNGFENTLVFTDEATFHLCGKVSHRNLRFWGTENVHATLKHQRDSSKVNVFCAYQTVVFLVSFFAEKSINGDIYQDMLSEWLLPQLEEAVSDFILQQDGSPPHWNKNAHEFLNERLHHRWIVRAGSQDLTCLHWSARSLDLTPCDFFSLGFR
ncbi:DUF4817 domain-containing protein [Trichonephila clavipes]|nr:DUF4817 domain-containing protein [Trichonephila clavipes]